MLKIEATVAKWQILSEQAYQPSREPMDGKDEPGDKKRRSSIGR